MAVLVINDQSLWTQQIYSYLNFYLLCFLIIDCVAIVLSFSGSDKADDEGDGGGMGCFYGGVWWVYFSVENNHNHQCNNLHQWIIKSSALFVLCIWGCLCVW